MAGTEAFLFYSQDFLIGTLTLPMEDRGKYITLLCYMHSHGRMTEDEARGLVGDISEPLRAKFKTDEQGLWYNARLEKEINGRVRFVGSRKRNGNKGGRPQKELNETEALLFEEPVTTDVLATIKEPEIPPAPEKVKKYFMRRGLSAIDAEYETLKFMAYYTGRDWKTNKGMPVTNLKAAITNWLTHRNQFTKYKPKTLTEQWLA